MPAASPTRPAGRTSHTTVHSSPHHHQHSVKTELRPEIAKLLYAYGDTQKPAPSTVQAMELCLVDFMRNVLQQAVNVLPLRKTTAVDDERDTQQESAEERIRSDTVMHVLRQYPMFQAVLADADKSR